MIGTWFNTDQRKLNKTAPVQILAIFYVFLLYRPPCPHRMIIVGWCSYNNIIDDIGILDSVALV